MLAVATAPLSEAFRQTTGAVLANKYLKEAGAKKQGSLTKRRERAETARLVDEALHSALTKYDTPEALFTAGSSPSAVAGLLLNEMKTDLTDGGAHAIRAAEAATKQYVGKAYAAWKGSPGIELPTGV